MKLNKPKASQLAEATAKDKGTKEKENSTPEAEDKDGKKPKANPFGGAKPVVTSEDASKPEATPEAGEKERSGESGCVLYVE